MIKKKINCLIFLLLLTFSLVGCGKDGETTNASIDTTEHSTYQQTTTSNKTTEERVTTTEDMTITSESIDQLQIESMENPLQFGDVVTIHTEYMPNPMDVYEVEAEISITGYENEYISCDVKLKNVTPVDASNENQDIFFDCNFMSFTLYDENYVPIDYGCPINSLEGTTQGESNKLTTNQVYKGKIGPLKGSYDGAIPKYISFAYAREYSGQTYFDYYVYYEIPDGLFDTNYTYVDMSVMGADTAEQALALFKEALNNNDADIAKKISLYYYMCYEKTGRVQLEEWEYIDYLVIEGMHYNEEYRAIKIGIDSIVEAVNQDDFSVRTYGTIDLEEAQDELSEYGATGYLQAGYNYEYEFSYDYCGISYDGCTFDISLLMCDGRWFIISGEY